MIDLDRIDAYCKAATEGPWVWEDHDLVSAPLLPRHREQVKEQGWSDYWDKYKIIVTDGGYYPPHGDDATFIENARTDLPAVVAELRQARKMLRSWALWGEGHTNKWETGGELTKATRAFLGVYE